MIPKKIHYCWFGGNPLSELAQKCIASWKKHCPDYEVKEWNEDNFDLNCCPYIKEAAEAKKWAFVTDYVRLKALIDEGGIYMDTDVELLRPIDCFLNETAFSGFETEKAVPTGIMASEKNFSLFKVLLDDYNSRHFILKDGSYDLTTNVKKITMTCVRLGLKQSNEKQTIAGMTFYPKDFFCPKDSATGKIICTDNTYTIHHFSGSWLPEKTVRAREFEKKVIQRFGYNAGKKIIRSYFWLIGRYLYTDGIGGTLKKCREKIKDLTDKHK